MNVPPSDKYAVTAKSWCCTLHTDACIAS